MAACSGPCRCATFREHIAGVRIAPSATPTTTGGQHAFVTKHKEKKWSKDHDAYRRLRRDGVQPGRLDGAARLEATAVNRQDVEAPGVTAPPVRS